MTTIKDTYDVWHKAALRYVRDQLRANAVVGLSTSEGVVQIEVGDVRLDDITRMAGASRAIWITPRTDTTQRMGNVIQHVVRVDVHVFSSVATQSMQAFGDAQERFRDFTGRAYNEVLDLHDDGIAAGVWMDWQPNGAIEPVAINAGDKDLLMCILPFEFTMDRVWINGV